MIVTVLILLAALAVLLPGLVWNMLVTERAEVVRLRHENALLMRRIAHDSSMNLGHLPGNPPEMVADLPSVPQTSFFRMKKPEPPAGYPPVS